SQGESGGHESSAARLGPRWSVPQMFKKVDRLRSHIRLPETHQPEADDRNREAGHHRPSITDPLREPAPWNHRERHRHRKRAEQITGDERRLHRIRAASNVDEDGDAYERHHDAEADQQIDTARRREIAVREDVQIENRIADKTL